MSAQGMECVVHGALAALLRVMRVVGMIPVRLVPLSDAFVVRYSFAQDVIARFFGICFNLIIMTMETHYLIPKVLSNNTQLHKLALFLSIFIAVILRSTILTAAVFNGRQRTEQLCKNLNEIEKLNIEGIHDIAVVKVEKTRFMFFLILLVSGPMLKVIEIILVGVDTTKEIDYLSLVRKISYQFGILLISTLEGQFVFTILSVHTALQALNRRLGKLLIDLKKNKESSDETSSAPRTLRKLATSYSTLCDLMKTLDKENGFMILVAFILLLIYAIQSIFFVIVFWDLNTLTTFAFTENESEKATLNRILLCFQCVHIVAKFMFLLEPCQWTYNEMEVTRLFVTRLTHYAPTRGPLGNELEKFYRLVFTNIPSYSPLQLFTLKRSFILEISGTLITWMLIVLRNNRPKGDM
nr:gustatory receptor 13.2 [Papilio memnon]